MPANKSVPSFTRDGSASSSSAQDADEREFADFAGTQDLLDIEATTWAILRSEGLDAVDEAKLQAWLAADPRHAEALAEMETTLDDVQKLPDDEVVSLKAGVTAFPGADARSRAPETAHASPPHASGSGWTQWLPRFIPQMAVATVAVMAIGGGWFGWEHWRSQPTFAQSYATSPGQLLTIHLPDGEEDAKDAGSRLQLDTSTQVHAQLYRDHREVHLKDGQAIFTVRSDASRPFHVWAGGVRITVVGTRFAVRHTTSGLDSEQTVIAVEEGRVRIVPSASVLDSADAKADASRSLEHGAVELSAGQMIVADKSGHLGQASALPAHSFAPWREGRLDFAMTPLSQAIAEFARYGQTDLVVRDPAIAALPVGGSYGLRQSQRFAETLPLVLPVRLVRKGNFTEIVAR